MSNAKFNVLCTLPNASEEISGIAFKATDKPEPGMLAENLSADQAALFKGIPGYSILTPSAPKNESPAEKKEREAREARIADLTAKATAAREAATAARADATAKEEAAKSAADADAAAATKAADDAAKAADEAETKATEAEAALADAQK